MRHGAEEMEPRLTRKFKAEFGALEDRLKADPDGDPIIWPIAGQLACSRRPLRDHRDFQAYVYEDHLPAEAGLLVVAWVERVLAAGVCSVICLLPDWQPKRYRGLCGITEGLLALYKSRGLEVRQVACPDPRHERVQKGWVEEIKLLAYQAFLDLPKPVLPVPGWIARRPWRPT